MKNVIITGGGTGIGEAIAKIFCKNGYKVYILGRRKEKLEKVCESSDNSINYFVCDINKDNDIKSILNQLDKVDTLINCAGIISSGEESEKYDSLELNNIIDTNLKGTLSICLQMIDKWKDDNIKGNIINIGSIASKNGSKYFPLYASAKAGIIAFSKSIAARYGEFGIRCNVISPGVIKTPMSYVETPNFDDYIENIENRTPLKRLGKPNDIAKVALFLDSDNSEFITGQEIVVDGGYTLSQE
jgi:NAD(P)-dependent dehydrogenase (short-subunit alcohol dehydrogenase family)